MVGGDGRELEVGDLVDVPGSMYGIVRFIGSVLGKKGMFAGVELGKEFAARGKNDGDVDG
jgi:dynactin complex subunit